MAFAKIVSLIVLAVGISNSMAQNIVSQNVANNGLYGANVINPNLGLLANPYPNTIIQGNSVGLVGNPNLGYANTYPYGIAGLPLGYANNYGQNGQVAVQNVAVTNNNCQACGYQGPLVYPNNANCGSCGNCGKVVVV